MLRHLVLLVAFACLGARGWRLHLFISPTSVGGVRVFRQPHVAVISVTLSSLLVVVRRKRSARLLTAYWRDVAVSGVLRLKS